MPYKRILAPEAAAEIRAAIEEKRAPAKQAIDWLWNGRDRGPHRKIMLRRAWEEMAEKHGVERQESRHEFNVWLEAYREESTARIYENTLARVEAGELAWASVTHILGPVPTEHRDPEPVEVDREDQVDQAIQEMADEYEDDRTPQMIDAGVRGAYRPRTRRPARPRNDSRSVRSLADLGALIDTGHDGGQTDGPK